jgi:peptide/nickel transport system substrate-binding protein
MRFVVQLLVSAILLLSAGFGQTGTVLTIGIDVDAGTMDPRLARDTSAARMQDLLFNGLVRLDPQLVPRPDLALSWEFTSPTLLVMRLRPGVVFHDGQAFTADDVVHTYTTLLDQAFAAPRRALYTPITRVEAVDPLTVRFVLSQPYAPLLQYLDIGIVPRGAATRLGAEFGNNPVGTGPFRLVQWQKGNRIDVAANDRYFRGRPRIDGLSIRVIPDNNVRLLALESGDLAFIHSPVPPQDLERLRREGRFALEATTALGYTYLNLNTQDPILSDVRVRQALAWLSDRQTISGQIFFGMDRPGESFLLPGTFYYSNQVNRYGFDLERANRLLDEAGWTRRTPGGIREKGGQPLRLELITNIDPNRQQILEFLQGEWRRAGIEATVRVYDFAAMLNDLIAGRYQVSLIGWLLLTDPDRATFLQFRSNGASNYGKYSNPEVDRLLDQGRSETNPERRKEIYLRLAQTITADAPYVFLLYQGYVVIHDRRLQGFVVHPGGAWWSFESATWR